MKCSRNLLDDLRLAQPADLLPRVAEEPDQDLLRVLPELRRRQPDPPGVAIRTGIPITRVGPNVGWSNDVT